MPDTEPGDYEKIFKDIIRSFEEFTNSQEYRVLGSDDQNTPSALIGALGNYVTTTLKQASNPDDILKLIGVIDKVYFQCLMKNEICSSIFEILYKEDKALFSKFEMQLPEDLKNDKDLLAGCVAGALLKEEYLRLLKKAGFSIEILDEDSDISKRQYGELPVESLKLKAWI